MTIDKKILVTACFATLFFISCNKKSSTNDPTNNECYDAAFHEQHKNDICLTDCPGVIGCDGKSYCNECNMHANGIKKTQ